MIAIMLIVNGHHQLPNNDRNCDNFFHYLCQNDYDTEKFDSVFDQIHGVKKRCKSCIEMKVFVNSLKISFYKQVKKIYDKEVHQRFTNDNPPEDVYDSDAIVIDEDDDNNNMVDEDENE